MKRKMYILRTWMWESARFTKPEKQLTAYETWRKLYPDIDMKDTLKSLGFWEGK